MKKDFIEKFDIIHTCIDKENPLSIGNGNFAYTCDCTGLQTFYQEYNSIPLCTMSNLIWGHQKGKGVLPFQEYVKASDGTKIQYMTDVTAKDYQSFRDDTFKFDLFKLRLLYQNQPLDLKRVKLISQKLFLYDGSILSEFEYAKEKIFVEIKIPQTHNNIRIKLSTKLKHLHLEVFFLVPSSNMQGGEGEDGRFQCFSNKIERKTDVSEYTLNFKTNMRQEKNLFVVEEKSFFILSLDNDFEDDTEMHQYFDMVKPIDTQDEELNRRVVLSLYLMKINTLGCYPPAETGLTCNSWYGKFHLEMHLWHHLGLIRLGLSSYVIPSLFWYLSIYETSKERAYFQGYQGIRLPKMTDYRGQDTPSPIGCLLIWQMPHLLIMLEEIYKQDEHALDFTKFIPMLCGIMDFLCSFYYKKDGKYHLDSPLIPANENVEYDKDTPVFEECYTLYAFQIFKKWIKRFNIPYDLTRLEDILENYVPLPVYQNCYEAFIGCTTTYTEYNYDHPMMVGMYSYFKSDIVDEMIIKNTLDKILNCWSLEQTWGWDFPMLAMSAYHIGDKELAIQILKKKALKNMYLKNGHNPQYPKKELPLYLPGNGAFLLAISHIFGGNENENL